MNKISSVIISLVLGTSVFAQQKAKTPEMPIEEKLYQPVVVIENFSSEGCSSCPIADEFLAKIIHMSDSSNTPVYVLDFHVDLWNKAGWVDKYSDSNFTLRQKSYIGKVPNQAMYTPQAFLNGTVTWPGNAQKEIGQFIQNTLQQPLKHFLRITAFQNALDSITIDYNLWGKTDSSIINFAIVFNEIYSKVTAGENANKLLHHHNVVKFFKTENVIFNRGRSFIKIPPGFDLSQARLIAFVQHERSWQVLAADQLIIAK